MVMPSSAAHSSSASSHTRKVKFMPSACTGRSLDGSHRGETSRLQSHVYTKVARLLSELCLPHGAWAVTNTFSDGCAPEALPRTDAAMLVCHIAKALEGRGGVRQWRTATIVTVRRYGNVGAGSCCGRATSGLAKSGLLCHPQPQESTYALSNTSFLTRCRRQAPCRTLSRSAWRSGLQYAAQSSARARLARLHSRAGCAGRPSQRRSRHAPHTSAWLVAAG